MDSKMSVGKALSAANCGYNRGNHIFNQGVNNSAKSRADDDTDGQVHHIAAQDKFLKFVYHFFLPLPKF